jgi:Protein of unknown function (DUF1670)
MAARAVGGGCHAEQKIQTQMQTQFEMINNSAPKKWQRLEQKNLDKQFVFDICAGCSCSPFEAQAILETVNRVYGQFFDNSSTLQPGQIQMSVISTAARVSHALSKAPMVIVTLTLNDDTVDLGIRKSEGVVGLRQHKLERICTEAVQQGGLLTVEDLANRLFNCGERTICRDIKDLKDKGIILPLRSTIKDMGRSLSHRSLIIKHWLLGKEYSYIARETCHSVKAISNYVEKFKRVVTLNSESFDNYTIAFLVRISPNLVQEYLDIFKNLDIVPFRKEELAQLSKKNKSANLQN